MLQRLLPLLFASLLVLLPYTNVQAAEVRAAPVQQQTGTTYQAIVNTTANIRSGPGTQYAVVTQVQAGQSLTVVACNEDCSWLKLDTGNWIAAFLVELVDPSSTTNNGGTRTQLIDPDDLVLIEASPAALEIVEQILSYTGLPQNFKVYSSNIYNAAALMANGERVILYDPQLIADIENVTDHDWPAVSILAHEIGHHLAGHTLAGEYIKQFELEADYFSGYILHKMGATLEEAQAVMNLLRDHPNMTDHPPQAERLVAIQNGWQEAARQESLVSWEPPFSNFAEEAAQNIEASLEPAQERGIFSVLQQTYNQKFVTESDATTYVAREWGLGLRALVTEDRIE